MHVFLVYDKAVNSDLLLNFAGPSIYVLGHFTATKKTKITAQ
jgi:hypothetical protein